MSIISSEIQYRYSGGAANSTALLSLGGAKSSVAVSALFDDVTGAEAAAGSVDYRCTYIHNANASLTLTGAVVWINSDTPSASTVVALGLGTSGMNGTEQSVATEGTAPVGVTFSASTTKATGIALGDIPAGQGIAVWIRRTTTAGAATLNSDPFTLRVEGDTA